MGKKKYYCDFCNRYFNDDKNTRTKHLSSVGHINMKKEHYNMFRDPQTVLDEELPKKPCRKFHYEGFCPFGGSCTFSHYSKADLDAIQNDLLSKKMQENLAVPTVDSWLQQYSVKVNAKNEEKANQHWSCSLPPEFLMNPTLVPPSLLPFNIKDFLEAETEGWG